MKKIGTLKKISRLKWTFSTLDVSAQIAPVATYSAFALFDKEALVIGILALFACIVISILLFVLNIFAKLKLRSPVWILILGLYLAIREKLLPLIIVAAIASALSDFVLHPLAKNYAAKYEKMKAEEAQQPQQEAAA